MQYHTWPCMHVSYRSTWRLAPLPAAAGKATAASSSPFARKGILRMVPTQWRQQKTHLLFLLLVFLVRGAHITYRHWRVTFDASYENGESVNHAGATSSTERRYRDLVRVIVRVSLRLPLNAAPLTPVPRSLSSLRIGLIVRWHRG